MAGRHIFPDRLDQRLHLCFNNFLAEPTFFPKTSKLAFPDKLEPCFSHNFSLGKPPRKCLQVQRRIAQIAIAPPPSVNRALWGTLFLDRIEQICQITVLMVISAPNHPGKHFGPLHNQAITHLNFNFHCISAPNHPGKHFDPPTIKQIAHLVWGT